MLLFGPDGRMWRKSIGFVAEWVAVDAGVEGEAPPDCVSDATVELEPEEDWDDDDEE